MKNLLLVTAFLLLPFLSQAQKVAKSSHYIAAEVLFKTMDMPKNMDENVQQMLTMQMEQVPAMKAAEIEVRSFFAKYMNYEAIKEELIAMYVNEFTEKELKEMTTFYASATGQKLAKKQTSLTLQSAQLGQDKLQAHLPELQRLIQNKMQAPTE